MILAEKLVLLSLDPERGKPAPGVEPARLRTGAATALLAELVLHGSLSGNERGLVLDERLPDFHPLLSETTRALHGHPAGLDPADAVRRVARANSGLVARLINNLVARDILHD